MKLKKYSLLFMAIFAMTGCDDDTVKVEEHAPPYVENASKMIESYLRTVKTPAECKNIVIGNEWLIACKSEKPLKPFLIYSIQQPEFTGDDYHIEAINRAARRYADMDLMKNLKIETDRR